MGDQPDAYDREWTTLIGPRSRMRVGYRHVRGRVVRFVVQIEYRLGDDWVEVVRADHDAVGEMAHDVTEEGVHVDVYRDGEKHLTETVFPATSASTALTVAEEHLSRHAERYVRRFEEWLAIDRRDR